MIFQVKTANEFTVYKWTYVTKNQLLPLYDSQLKSLIELVNSSARDVVIKLVDKNSSSYALVNATKMLSRSRRHKSSGKNGNEDSSFFSIAHNVITFD